MDKNSLKTVADRLCRPDFDRVLVACHRSPDGDATGSAHALAYALRTMGKQARVYCPDPFGKEFSYLTQAEAGLFPFEPDVFVTVDVASPEMLPDAPFLDKIAVVLDHHRINTVEGEIRVVDPEKASCGELILALFDEMGVELDSYLAGALYTAIATDTGCFRYSNTNEETFLAAARLSRYAKEGQLYGINKAMFETKSRLQLSLEAFAAREVELFCQGRVAFLSVSLEKQKALGTDYSQLDCLINVIRQLEGVFVSVVAKEREAGVYKVSVRSEAGFDASEFCRAFGGGGHRAAAGCTVAGSEEDVKRSLLSEAERRLS